LRELERGIEWFIIVKSEKDFMYHRFWIDFTMNDGVFNLSTFLGELLGA